MLFEMREKFLKIAYDGLPRHSEGSADFVGDLLFGIGLLQKFEHPRAHEVQPIHLSVANIEDDGPVVVVRGADVFQYLQHEKTSVSSFEEDRERGERVRNKEEKLLTRGNILEVILRCGNPCPPNAIVLPWHPSALRRPFAFRLYLSQKKESDRFRAISASRWRWKGTNDGYDLSHDLGVHTVPKALRADEAYRIGVHNDCAVLHAAASQDIRAISSHQEIDGLLPGRFVAKDARPSLSAVHDDEPRPGERRVQGLALSTHPEDIA